MRVFYLPRPLVPWREPALIRGLDANQTYRASLFDPKTGDEHPLGAVAGQAIWPVPTAPVMQDWAPVLESRP